jgi:hypothetical protein
MQNLLLIIKAPRLLNPHMIIPRGLSFVFVPFTEKGGKYKRLT